jgi:maleylpyruvate isomerase
MEFIDELHPQPRMLPQDLFLRAKARQMSQMVTSGIQPLHNLLVLQKVEALGGTKENWAAFWLQRGLLALETEAERFAGTCMVGDEITMADACLIPQLAAARRFGVKVEAFEVLHRVEQHLEVLPPFVAAHADKQIDAPTQASA